MTTIPRNPWRIFIDHAFEASFALGILLIALGSVASGLNPSGRLEGALDSVLYAAWRWGLILASLGVLTSLSLRPWAARRRPLSSREKSLAWLRTYEAASCIGLATSCFVYSITILVDGLDNAAFVGSGLLSFAWGFIIRALNLRDANRKRLAELIRVNDSID